MYQNNQFIRILLLSLILFLFVPLSAFAKEVTAKVSLPYKLYNNDTRTKGIKKARMSAWKKYIARFSVARKSTYLSNKQLVLERLEDLVIEEVIVQEKNDKEAKTYKVSLRVSFDDDGVIALFNDLNTQKIQGLSTASKFGSVLIARAKITSKKYDIKIVKNEISETEGSALQDEVQTKARLVASSRKKHSKEESTGSSSHYRTDTTWEIDESYQETLSAGIEESLVNAGFEPMDYNDLSIYGAPYMDEIYHESTDKAILKGRTKTKIKHAAKNAGWNYLGMGRVDLDLPIIDSATGLFKVAANVNYQVFILQDGEARVVAKVRAKQVYSLGETEDFATNQALNKAAQEAVGVVVDQLHKKGIR